MEVQKMYSVRDAKTEIFSNPFYAKTHGEAERNFSMAVNDNNPNNMLSKFPEDYQLWYIGEFDDHTGKMTIPELPIAIANAVQFVSKTQ